MTLFVGLWMQRREAAAARRRRKRKATRPVLSWAQELVGQANTDFLDRLIPSELYTELALTPRRLEVTSKPAAYWEDWTPWNSLPQETKK